MKHIVLALFENTDSADRAIAALVEDDRRHSEHISLVVHRDALSETELAEAVQHSKGTDETDATRGLALGASLGAATGAVVGALLAGPFGLIGGGPLVGELFGAGTGSLHGMLWSGIVGAGLTDHSLKKLAERIEAGDVLITVRAPDKPTEDRVEAILHENGATIAEKHVLE